MLTLGILIYMTFVGMTMVFLLIESRLPRLQTALIIYGCTTLLISAEVILSNVISSALLVHIYSPLVHIPALIITSVISRYRGWKLIFQFMSAILFCTVIHQVSRLVYFFSDRELAGLILAYVILTPVSLWAIHAYLVPTISRVLTELNRGWMLICLVIALYYGITVYLIPGYVGDDLISTVLKPAISLLMIGFYCLALILFSVIKADSDIRHNTQLMQFSLSALQSRIEAVRAAEDSLRIERHDLRHRFLILSHLITQEKYQEALDFIGSAQLRLDNQKTVHWCHFPILDAVFSSYFEQARRQEIQVNTRISLPEQLPAQEAELAVVFANALENAIHANMKLPPEQREISCKIIHHPRLIFEISNPCTREVHFNSQGLPVSSGNGHGIGSHSIAVFCKKYHASYQYTCESGRFSLCVIL